MLPQFGLSEFLLVAIIALIVVGPKDLPLMMRKLGQFAAKLRAMARDFQSAFDEMGRQAEIDALKKEVEALKSANPLSEASKALTDVEQDLKSDAAALNKPKV